METENSEETDVESRRKTDGSAQRKKQIWHLWNKNSVFTKNKEQEKLWKLKIC